MPNVSINAWSSIRVAGSRVIYFDPFKTTEARHDADIVFVTHEHFDHFSVEDLKNVCNEKTILVAPFSMRKTAEENAGGLVGKMVFPKAEDAGTELEVDGVSVRWVRAYNVGKPFHKKESDWIGYIVTMDGTSYYVTGDTDANEDNSAARCDVLLVPCGGKFTFDVEEAVRFAEVIRPKKAIPTHYSQVPGESEAGEQFRRLLGERCPEIAVDVLV